MLFREIVALNCENRTKDVDTLCRQHIRLLNVEARGTFSYHCALNSYTASILKFTVLRN
jgi:hypothetical protein